MDLTSRYKKEFKGGFKSFVWQLVVLKTELLFPGVRNTGRDESKMFEEKEMHKVRLS